MMNEDEIIKSKLNAFRPAFEEADWKAMEKLLDKKEDKKPIVIWWKYGLAIGLLCLLGAGVISYQINKEHISKPISTIATNTTNTSISKKLITSTSNTTTKNNKNATENQLMLPNKSINTTPINNATSNAKSVNHSSSKNMNGYNSINTNVYTTATSAKNRLMLEANANVDLYNASTIVASSVIAKQNMIDFTKNNLNEIQNSVFENSIKTNQSDFSTIKKRKNINIPIEYSIGLQAGGLINFAFNRNNVKLYLDQMSDAGIIGQVMFANRVGIYAGVNYVDRKANSKIDNSLYTDITYTIMNVKNDKKVGVSIPIGITTNLYKQAYFNIYSKVGINNIIFLKQITTIEYLNNISTITYIPIDNTTQIGNALVSSSADYSIKREVEVNSNLNNGYNEKTYKYTSAEKYLAELNIAFGIKSKMTKNLSFVFEPAYRVGFKNKNRTENTHSIALTGAFICSF